MQTCSAFGNHTRQSVRMKKIKTHYGQSYLKGALVISAGGFVSKLLGAVYRIPLLAFLGGDGMGIYQMVYPLYCILLTVSASGIPTGIARIISSGQCAFAERSAIRLYGFFGFLGSIIMFLLSSPLAAAQGEPSVALCCRLLAPSVFFVSLISVVRGYFQGKGNMTPTAVTEIAEQLIKVVAGVVLCYIFRDDVFRAVSAAVLAVTISEVFSACLAAALYLRSERAKAPLYFRPSDYYRPILRYTIPLTFTAMAMPLSQLAESIVLVWILRGMADNATSLWGIFSGCAMTLINLPVSLTYGLAAAGVPRISPLAQSGRMDEAKVCARKALMITLAVSAPCAAALYIFAPLAADIIFSSLSSSERELLITLVRIMSVNAVTLSLVQTSSACLTSLGKPLCGTITQWLTSVLRVILSALFAAFTPLSVCGAAVAANICYFVAVLLNLWYIIRVRGKANENNVDRTWSKRRRYDAVG